MELARKLQMKPGCRVAVIGAPAGVDLTFPADVTTVDDASQAETVIAFVLAADDLDSSAAPALEAARADRLAWLAYPKGGQLGTQLNRDRLAAAAQQRGAQPVRQVSVDDVWSALRFRPA